MTTMARVAGTIVSLALSTALVAGCAQGGGPAGNIDGPAGNVEQGNTLDQHSDKDLSFFGPIRPGEGVVLVREPASLDAALEHATATVMATVSGVEAGRTIHDLQFIEVELTVTEVLHGALRPELKGVVRVEFVGAFLPEPVAAKVDKMRAALAPDPAVWLLRWQGEPSPNRKPGVPAEDPTADKTLYRVVHPNSGVFAQGEKGVVVATSHTEEESSPRGAQLEGEKFRKLSDLAARVRKA